MIVNMIVPVKNQLIVDSFRGHIVLGYLPNLSDPFHLDAVININQRYTIIKMCKIMVIVK